MNRLYTVREIAQILKKRQAFVRAEIAAGRLDAMKLSQRGIRISEEALQQYMRKLAG